MFIKWILRLLCDLLIKDVYLSKGLVWTVMFFLKKLYLSLYIFITGWLVRVQGSSLSSLWVPGWEVLLVGMAKEKRQQRDHGAVHTPPFQKGPTSHPLKLHSPKSLTQVQDDRQAQSQSSRKRVAQRHGLFGNRMNGCHNLEQ